MTIKKLKSIYEEYRDLCYAVSAQQPNSSLLYQLTLKRIESLRDTLDIYEHLLLIDANLLKKYVDQGFKNIGLNHCSLTFENVSISIVDDNDSYNVLNDYAEIGLKIYNKVIPLKQCNLVEVDINDFYSGRFSIPMLEFLDDIDITKQPLANAMKLIYNATWDTLKVIIKNKNKTKIEKNNEEKSYFISSLSKQIPDKSTLNEVEILLRKQINIEKENIKLADDDILLS